MTRDFPAGNYRYAPAKFQYSNGVVADPGFEIERVRFDTPIALADGFSRIADYILGAGRPLTSFCACELRSSAALDEEGFRRFNEHYVKTLAEWGVFDGTNNPAARSNVSPEIDAPGEPSFYAFSFTRPSSNARPSFIVSGSGEARGGPGSYPERITRYRDTSPDGIREKAAMVRTNIEARLGVLGFGWKDTTATQVYTVHDFHPVVVDELVRHGAARFGMTWHFARPPVVDLEFEIDTRRVMRELVT